MAKDIRFDRNIWNTDPMMKPSEARAHAQKLAADKVRVVHSSDPYILVADGAKCPCCDAIVKLEFK